jgi:hypothetical protein
MAKPKKAAAVAIFATCLTAQAQTPIWDIQPLPIDRAVECLTYMRPFGQYTHPSIGPFEVGVFRDERGRFWTVRLAPGYKPKEGEEVVVNSTLFVL